MTCVTLSDYDDLLAFGDLRGGNEYVTHLRPDVEREVCAIVLARYGPTAGGTSDATLLVEFDRRGPSSTTVSLLRRVRPWTHGQRSPGSHSPESRT
jgi:hypothetical protein